MREPILDSIAAWGEKFRVVAADGLVKGALEKKVVSVLMLCWAVGALGSFGKFVFSGFKCCGQA